jgi:hypothetical protein
LFSKVDLHSSFGVVYWEVVFAKKRLPKWPIAKLTAQALAFEGGSQMARIEQGCFENRSLWSLCIPENVQEIDGSAFRGCAITSLSIHPDNSRFMFDWDCLLDGIDAKLVRFFGGKLIILNEIKIISRSFFTGVNVDSNMASGLRSQAPIFEE